MEVPEFLFHAQIEQHHWWFLARRRIMSAIIRAVLPPASSQMVVDVGCGTGGNIAALADDYACVGIDRSPDAIALASERFRRVRFICGSTADDYAEAAAGAGLLLLMDVLEHVQDDFRLVSDVLSVTPPGAHVLITVPANMALWTRHDESFGHYRRYDRARLERVWEGLPVSVRLLSYYNAHLYPVVRMIRMLDRFRGQTNGRVGADFRIPAGPMNGILERIFASEAKPLVDQLRGRRRQAFTRGVSLIALLRREPGPLAPRSKPGNLAPDPYHPTPRAAGAPVPQAVCAEPV